MTCIFLLGYITICRLVKIGLFIDFLSCDFIKNALIYYVTIKITVFGDSIYVKMALSHFFSYLFDIGSSNFISFEISYRHALTPIEPNLEGKIRKSEISKVIG